MKLKKLITVFTSVLLMTSTPILTNADTLETNNYTSPVVSIEDALPTSELNKYSDDEEPLRALNYLKDNAVSSTTTEYYVRSITDSNGNTIVDPKKYTETEYNAIEIKNSLRDFNNNQYYENSWMKLKLEAYKLSNGDYDFYMFYNWKNRPFLTFNDVIGFSYPSTLSCDTTSAMSYHRQTIVNPTTLATSYTTEVHKSNESSNFKSSMNGVSFKFDLPSAPDTWPAYYEGYLNVHGDFTNPSNTSSTIELSYIHQQISLPYDIQDAVEFLTTGSIKVKIAGGQDEFRAADRFNRF